MSGSLYLIPSALGDTPWSVYLPDSTRNTICRLSRFIAENAKTTRGELKRLEHPVPLQESAIDQLPERLPPAEIDRLLSPLLAGQDVGLMSEAGCPGVADPGALLVRRAHELKIPVRPLVGPTSLLLALMASGLEGQRFAFHGYLPAREPERSRRIAELEKDSQRLDQTQLFIETPYRNTALFQALMASCRPDTRVCIATDLTLPTETVETRKVAEWRNGSSPAIDRRPTVFLLLSGR
jgi:16S rRNA (cytidine1402-2'-O)-methyltransferase